MQVNDVRKDGTVHIVHHNMSNSNSAESGHLFHLGYIHPEPIQLDDFFEIRIEDFGDRHRSADSNTRKLEAAAPMCVGIGVGCSDLKVTPEFPDPAAFQYGIMADSKGAVLVKDGETTSALNRTLGKIHLLNYYRRASKGNHKLMGWFKNMIIELAEKLMMVKEQVCS